VETVQSAGKIVGHRPLLSSSLLPWRKDFWELKHKVSDGLQFLREQQDLLGYTYLASELPGIWCTLKLKEQL